MPNLVGNLKDLFFLLVFAIIIAANNYMFLGLSTPRYRELCNVRTYMNRNARKPVFGVSDQVPHKSICTVIVAG